MRHSPWTGRFVGAPSWTTDPDFWTAVGAIGTVGATFLAGFGLLMANRDRQTLAEERDRARAERDEVERRRREELRREQALQVTAYPTQAQFFRGTEATVEVTVYNSSPGPIDNVVVTLGVWRDGQHYGVKTLPLPHHGVASGARPKVIFPRVVLPPDSGWNQLGCAISFRDAFGVQWSRDFSNNLTERPQTG